MQQNAATPATLTPGAVERDEASDAGRPITGKVVAIGGIEEGTASSVTPPLNEVPVMAAGGNPDKLQMTIEALRANPGMTDEALAEYLALKRPASARFWRLKAIEILNAPGRETGGYSARKTAAPRDGGSWPTPAGISNGNGTASRF